MATVTQGTPTPSRHDIGDLILRVFVVSGVTGSTLATNMVGVIWASNQSFTQAGTATLITGITVNAVTGLLTFTSSAPMVNEVIAVVAHQG